MWIKKRHVITNFLLRITLVPFMKIKYRLKLGKRYSFNDGSIIVSNHVTSMDQFMVGALIKQHTYIISTRDLFNHRFIGKLIFNLLGPISKEKSNSNDIVAIKNCVKVSKEKGNIVVFAEGNRSINGNLCIVDKSIAKLVKLLKKPLVIVNIVGGYGVEPRWSNRFRKGRLECFVKKVYPYQELENKDVDEIYDLILNGINVDNYKYSPYKSRKKAEYLERVVYRCPKCGSLHTLHSKGNYLSCSSCDLKVKYNEDLTLSSEDQDFKFKYLSDWYKYQIDELKKETFKDDEIIFKDEVKIYEPRLYKNKLLVGRGSFELYSKYFLFKLENKEIKLPLDEVKAITILGRKKLNIYHGKKTYQILGDIRLNFVKYMNAFYLLKGEDNDEFMGL